MFNSYLAYKYGASDKFIMISNNIPKENIDKDKSKENDSEKDKVQKK